MKDLIIGGASNYTWDQLKYWVNSIKMSGFTGDIALVATNIKKEDIEKLVAEGVLLSLYGKQNEFGDFVAHSNGAPHVERFFYIWNFLKNVPTQYRYVITTDTRDVVFQTNPSDWLEEHMVTHNMVASSEGMRYVNEPWGNQNLLETFGPYFHNIYKNNIIFNVGTIAGDHDYVTSMMFMIFQMSINRPIAIVDQAVYNVLLNTIPWSYDTFAAKNEDAWAIQLGTTLESIKSGKGDLGMAYMNRIEDYHKIYEDEQPKLVDGFVVNQNNQKFCIVHQYDRTVAWKDSIIERYS